LATTPVDTGTPSLPATTPSSEMGKTYIRGVDEPLPEGETLLWEGAPDAGVLARYGFRAGWIAGYFALLAVVALFLGGAGTAVARVTWIVILGAVATGLAWGWSWLVARNSVYTLTDRRLVMQIGVAFPSVFNVPLNLIEQVAVKEYGDGAGDVALDLREGNRIGYLFLWPHTRPWRLSQPQPMLRGLPEVEGVAEQMRAAVVAGRTEMTDPGDSAGQVIYSVQDEDGTEILSNRRAPGEPQQA